MPFGYATTVYPDGVTNAPTGSALQTYVLPDPTTVHTFTDDFNTFAAASWTVTKTQSGATQAIIAGDGGILSLVNTAAAADLNAIQLAFENFAITPGKPCWLKVKFSLSDALHSAAVIGLQITDVTPLAVSDGFYFSKPDASTTVSFVAEKSSAATTTAVGTMASGVLASMGAHYDGNSNITLYFNDVRAGSCAITNLPTHTLTISAAVSNGVTAAAVTMNIDYIVATTER
jgi:hypothetical protein